MADIKFGAKDYSGVKKLNFPLSDGSGYAQFSLGGSESAEHTWNQIPELVRNFLDNVTYDPSDYTTSQIANYAPATADVNNTYPVGVEVETSEGVLDRQGYEISVSDGNTTIYNDIPNQFTEYTVRKNGAVSQAGTLKPTGVLRQIKCVNAANVRDLGGWACDGGTIKYGKLFRGGSVTVYDAPVLAEQCGVMVELDLRGKEEAHNATESVLGADIEYVCTDSFVWYSLTNTEDWKTILSTVFQSAKYGKPVYFHCSAGADRTGTVACIIEAILGVSQSDIDKDYELTCFALGMETDAYARRRNETDWTGLINQITALSTGSTFRDKVLNWVASLGFTVDEINDFRTAMIDGTPDTITLNIGTSSVTNTLTNVNSDNDAVSVVNYQPYEATIKAPAGYAIETVKVTMGGVDITSSALLGTRTNLNRAVSVTLTNCIIDNEKKAVIDGQGYGATLTASGGYTLDGGTVKITMGGTDVSNYYSNGKIAIPRVTGDLVITATAIPSAPAYTNLADPISSDWANGKRLNSSAQLTDNAETLVTNFIPCVLGDTISIKGLDVTGRILSTTARNAYSYNSSGSLTGGVIQIDTLVSAGLATVDGDVTTFPAHTWSNGTTADTGVKMRFTGKLLDGYTAEDVVITVNEPIE